MSAPFGRSDGTTITENTASFQFEEIIMTRNPASSPLCRKRYRDQGGHDAEKCCEDPREERLEPEGCEHSQCDAAKSVQKQGGYPEPRIQRGKDNVEKPDRRNGSEKELRRDPKTPQARTAHDKNGDSEDEVDASRQNPEIPARAKGVSGHDTILSLFYPTAQKP